VAHVHATEGGKNKQGVLGAGRQQAGSFKEQAGRQAAARESEGTEECAEERVQAERRRACFLNAWCVYVLQG